MIIEKFCIGILLILLIWRAFQRRQRQGSASSGRVPVPVRRQPAADMGQTGQRLLMRASMEEKNAQHIAGQIGRICFYEGLLRQAEQSLAGEASLKGTAPEDPDLAEQIRKLDSYYGSPEWKEDLEADEAGLLPADLKRGVLSEDGIYNVLNLYSERFGAINRENV